MNASTIQGLASIIIPVWNQWEYTQQCIAALKEHTRPSWELIVVDNGSSDETKSYLAGVRDLSSVPVTIVSNTVNVGFPAAINQGLTLARGEYLVLLNNDVVVTDGWLDQLIALVNAKRSSVVSGQLSVVGEEEQTGRFTAQNAKDAEESAEIGLVGPMSNYASPPQLVERMSSTAISPRCTSLPGAGARNISGSGSSVPKLSAFCLLMKRAVFEKIGGLDERFGLGFFDDDDLAERARRAGFELAVAHDLFVHHFGSRTFAGNGIDAERLLDPDDAELWFRKAVVHRSRSESAEAENSWRRILGLRRPNQFCSVDQGIYGHLTRRNLAVLAAERGDHAEARRLWDAVLGECPDDREALARLG